MENFSIVYRTAQAEIAVSDLFRAVHLTWHSQNLDVEYLEVLYVAQKLIHQHQATNWVSRIEGSNLSIVNDRLWIEKEIIPATQPGLMQHLLFVLPPDIFKRYYADAFLDRERDNTPILAHHLSNSRDAVNWLWVYHVATN